GSTVCEQYSESISINLITITRFCLFMHSYILLKSETIQENGYRDYYEDHEIFINRAKSEYVLLIGSNILANIQMDSMLNFHLDEKADITVAYKKIVRNAIKKDTIFSTYDFENNAGNEIIGVTPLVDLPYDPAPVAFGLNILVAKTEVFLEYL